MTSISEPTPDDDALLIIAAGRARGHAYVPYSGFRMGAAAMLENGTIVQGTVVENVSLGLSMCAERAALFAAAVTAGGPPVSIALVAPRTGGQLTFPCGACLQVMLEVGGPELVVIAADSDGDEVGRATVGELLPRGPHKVRSAGPSRSATG